MIQEYCPDGAGYKEHQVILKIKNVSFATGDIPVYGLDGIITCIDCCGRNAILKEIDFQDGATARERNRQIVGLKDQKEVIFMMSKTHLAIGLATSLAVVQSPSLDMCAATIIGGTVGGVLADNDILDNDYLGDALTGQLLAFKITALTLGLDFLGKLGICNEIIKNPILSITGMVAFVILYIVGMRSNHRTFTHSFLALILYTAAAYLIYKPFAVPLAVAYFSHLVLDVLNKKKVPLFYPLKFGICLKLCYANKKANKVLMYIGFSVAAVMLVVNIFTSIIM